jgi:hypothetical protein
LVRFFFSLPHCLIVNLVVAKEFFSRPGKG